MHRPYRFAVAAVSALVAASLLAACGGGGGGSSPAPGGGATSPPVGTTPTPVGTPPPSGTIRPASLTSPGGCGTSPVVGSSNGNAVLSVYTITSNPSGQTVVADGKSLGVTPLTYTPADSGNLHTLAIGNGSNGAYTCTLYQSYDGNHTIFYNGAGDSKGSISLSSLQAVRRLATAGRSASDENGALARPHQSFSGPDVVPNVVAVRYRASSLAMGRRSARDIEGYEAAPAAVDEPTISSDPLRAVYVPSGTTAEAFARRLSAHAEVAEVTPVHYRHLLARAPQTPPNAFADNYNSWYLYVTGTNYAWSYASGAGIKIAMIDTGIDMNVSNLASQVVFQEKVVTPSDSNGNPVGSTQVTSNAQDYNGHGTATAGFAAAGSGSAGFIGVAYNAKILAFNIFPDTTTTSDQQSTTTTDEARAISDAIAQGADIINMSLGNPFYDTIEHDAVENAIARGVTVVAAAGNSDQGEPAGTIDYPANYPGVIAVGATTTVDNNTQTYASISGEKVASYSQYGANLAVVAPGGDALSNSDPDLLHWTLGYSTTTTNYAADKCRTPSPGTSCTTKWNGTSFATPIVSGVAALLQSLSVASGKGKLSPAQVAYLINSTADNIADAKQGHGRVNAYRALASFLHDTSAYSGPSPRSTSPTQLVAFAYQNSGSNQPQILDTNYPAGVPVGADGTFRIADVPAGTTYRVAVWYDANGDGYIDAGDQIGVSASGCSGSSVCSIGTITLTTVGANYTLP